MNIEPTRKAEGYYTLSKRLNHKHEKTHKTVQRIDSQFRQQIKVTDSISESSRFLIIVRDALKQQIEENQSGSRHSDEALDIQLYLLDKLFVNEYWNSAVKKSVQGVAELSLDKSLCCIDYNLSTSLRNIANGIYKQHGDLKDIPCIRGGDSDRQKVAIGSILKRAVRQNTLQFVGLTEEEKQALYRFFLISPQAILAETPITFGVGVGEPADITPSDIYDLKESALEKINAYFSK